MVPLWWLKYDVNKVFRKWDEVMGPQSADMDPILKLKKLGDQMLASSAAYLGQIQDLFIGMTISISVASGVMQLAALRVAPFSLYGAFMGFSSLFNTMLTMMTSMLDLAQGIIFMHIPLAMAVIGPLFVSGIMFSIYLPLVPYLLFLFGAISWLISVLVLMAAAPIICFLMLWGNSSQENPLLAREAEQFVMQVIGVFFRPTLMIIGLIAGMVLSYISVDILNLGFFNFVDVIITPNDGAKVKLIKQIGIIAVYTFTMMTVINMSFSTIYLLYSEAMRVAGISAPAVGMEAPQLEAVKGAGMRVAEAGVAGMKGRATALKGAAKARGGQIPSTKGKTKAAGAKGEKEKEESG
jgi:conjugal transfer/type IV secretion protein DotA/TraY